MAKRTHSMMWAIPSPPPDFSSPLPIGTSSYMPLSPCPTDTMSEMEFFLWECLREPEIMDCVITNEVVPDEQTLGGGDDRMNEPMEPMDETRSRIDMQSNWSIGTQAGSQVYSIHNQPSGLIFRMTPEARSARNLRKNPRGDPDFQKSMLYGAGSWCDGILPENQNAQYKATFVEESLHELEQDLQSCGTESSEIETHGAQNGEPRGSNRSRQYRKPDNSGRKTPSKR